MNVAVITAVVVAVPLVGIAVGRLMGYRLGRDTVVRCGRGHLFTTIWVPGGSLKSVRLGPWRLQWCPVGSHWALVVPVKDDELSDVERAEAASHHDVRVP